MHIGSVMTEIVSEADTEYTEVAEEYEEDVLVVGVPKAFTNFSMSSSYRRQTPVHNLLLFSNYYACCALSFEEKDLHHLLIKNKTYFY